MTRRSQRRFGRRLALTLLAIALAWIPVRLAIAYQFAPDPEAILTLGGGHAREVFTAEMAQAYPSLDVWVSSGSERQRALSIFESRGIERSRVRLDRCARDTLTNFTCIVEPLQQQGVGHVLVLTDDTHITRAGTIAAIVLGSRGIAFTTVAIPTDGNAEAWYKTPRDAARALVWAYSGGLITLAALGPAAPGPTLAAPVAPGIPG